MWYIPDTSLTFCHEPCMTCIGINLVTVRRWEKSRITDVHVVLGYKVVFFHFSNWIFHPKQRWWMVWKSPTQDVTENISTFSSRRCNSVKMSNPVGYLGLTLSHWWKVLWILKSFEKLENALHTVYSNSIYPWFLSKTKSKLVTLHRQRPVA